MWPVAHETLYDDLSRQVLVMQQYQRKYNITKQWTWGLRQYSSHNGKNMTEQWYGALDSVCTHSTHCLKRVKHDIPTSGAKCGISLINTALIVKADVKTHMRMFESHMHIIALVLVQNCIPGRLSALTFPQITSWISRQWHHCMSYRVPWSSDVCLRVFVFLRMCECVCSIIKKSHCVTTARLVPSCFRGERQDGANQGWYVHRQGEGSTQTTYVNKRKWQQMWCMVLWLCWSMCSAVWLHAPKTEAESRHESAKPPCWPISYSYTKWET